MKRSVIVLMALAGCGEIAGIKDLTSDEVPDAGTTPILDAGADVSADIVDSSPPLDVTETEKGFRRVFVTSQRWDGKEIAGVEKANSKCDDMAAAGDAGLSANGEKYFAWLSASSRASSQLTFDGPYRLLNGTEIAANKAKFESGSLLHAIDVNEKGNPPDTAELRVWTGTAANGNIAETCSGWMSDAVLGTFGRADQSGSGWTQAGNTACGVQLRLYCIER
jgi:hypothetical protein